MSARAVVGLEQAEPEPDGRRLAGAVRAEHGQQLAGAHREVTPSSATRLAVALRDIGEFGDGRPARLARPPS